MHNTVMFVCWLTLVLFPVQELTCDPEFIVSGASRTDICQGALGENRWVWVLAPPGGQCPDVKPEAGQELLSPDLKMVF